MGIALSTPSVLINGDTFAIVPNSLVVNLGIGETTVRAASVGGQGVESVHTRNAESMIGKFMFDIYVESDAGRNLQTWSNGIGANTLEAVSVAGENTSTYGLPSASLMNDPDIAQAADGKISLEWAGDPVIVG